MLKFFFHFCVILFFSWLKISLMIVDNGHCLLTSPSGRRSLESYASLRHSSSRLIVVTSGILDNAGDRLSHLDDQLKHLEKFYSCQTEASCELMSLLRFIANPRYYLAFFLAIIFFHVSFFNCIYNGDFLSVFWDINLLRLDILALK